MAAVVRRLVRALVALATIRAAIVVVGEFATAALLAIALTGWGLAWWERVVEPRLFASRRPATPSTWLPARRQAPAMPSADRHLRFAQALAVVAERYLDECQHGAADRQDEWR
jgi:hypothetical protein